MEGFDGNKEYRTTKSELKKVLEDAVVSLYLLATQKYSSTKTTSGERLHEQSVDMLISVLKSWCLRFICNLH